MRQITAAALAAMALAANAQEIVRTDAYIWHGDTITQGEYMATAPMPTILLVPILHSPTTSFR